MKVNEEQVEQLYAFTRKHYVVHYDLQTELVDHLAMGIEEQWRARPDLSFEDALQVEFKKFGIFGFMEVVEKRQQALSKKYRKLMWRHIKSFFGVPKIVFVILATSFLFLGLRLTNFTSDYTLYTLCLMFFAYFIIVCFNDIKKYRKRKGKTKRTWMFEEMILHHGRGFGAGFLPLYVFQVFATSENGVYFKEMNIYVLLALSFLFVMLCISIYIMTVEIPKRAKEYLSETYPEYELVEGV